MSFGSSLFVYAKFTKSNENALTTRLEGNLGLKLK